MNCKECGTANPSTAKACYKCGYPMQGSGTQMRDLLILAFVGIHLFSFLVDLVFDKVVRGGFGNGYIRYFRALIWAMSNLSLILPAAAIENKNIRIVAMVFSGLVGVYYAVRIFVIYF